MLALVPESKARAATMSSGTYRIPYTTGTLVEVWNDHLTHDPKTRIDMAARGSGAPSGSSPTTMG
jgi:hypothetical protein